MYGLYLKHVNVFFCTGALTSFTLLLKKGISEALARNRFKLGKFYWSKIRKNEEHAMAACNIVMETAVLGMFESAIPM